MAQMCWLTSLLGTDAPYDVEEVGLMLAELETLTKMFLFNDGQRLV